MRKMAPWSNTKRSNSATNSKQPSLRDTSVLKNSIKPKISTKVWKPIKNSFRKKMKKIKKKNVKKWSPRKFIRFSMILKLISIPLKKERRLWLSLLVLMRSGTKLTTYKNSIVSLLQNAGFVILDPLVIYRESWAISRSCLLRITSSHTGIRFFSWECSSDISHNFP